MAFGLIPRHTETLAFETLTQAQILVFALEAAKKLGWKISYISANGFIAYTKFSMSSWSEEVTLTIDQPSVTIKSECAGSQVVDWGKNKKNVTQWLEAFHSQQQSLSPETVEALYLQAQADFADGEADVLQQPPLTARDKVKNFFSIFIPTKGYFITPVLVNLNILIFVAMVASGVNVMEPDGESLLQWEANFRPVTLEGQWWRLITCCFIHIGIIHLAMNLYALVYIGLMLEPLLGKTRFLTAYLLTGIAGSVASLYWHDLIISAGASGAIFGLYGVFLAMLTTNLIEKSAREAMLTSILVFVGFNLVNGLRGGIDNAAHIGGLLLGLIIGYSYYPTLVKPDRTSLKYGIATLLTVVVLSTSFLVYANIPNDAGEHDVKMRQFAALETKALGLYNLGDHAPVDQQLNFIREEGIPNWKACIEVIRDADQLQVAEALHTRNKKLIEYCSIRIKLYEVLYKALHEESSQYDNQITEYNAQIESIISELQAGS